MNWRKPGLLILTLVVIGGGLFYWKIWSDRYIWPRKPVSSLQDLPPVDRGSWPKPPARWTTDNRRTHIATPAGLFHTNITYQINSLGMSFVRITPSKFWMGLSDEQAGWMNSPKKIGYPVVLTKPYYLCAHEVTLNLYEQFDPSFARHREKIERSGEVGLHPALDVTWQDAQRFCRWLSQKEGRLYRLPTEAEWEYACKAGTSTILYWGDNPWDRWKANTGGMRSVPESYYEDGYPFTSPAGTYPANPWGLYDMVGNAWEWVNDWFDWFPHDAAVDPTGPTSGKMRVKKGAGWDTRTRDLKSCARDGNNPADLFEKNGFRVLCEVEEPPILPPPGRD